MEIYKFSCYVTCENEDEMEQLILDTHDDYNIDSTHYTKLLSNDDTKACLKALGVLYDENNISLVGEGYAKVYNLIKLILPQVSGDIELTDYIASRLVPNYVDLDAEDRMQMLGEKIDPAKSVYVNANLQGVLENLGFDRVDELYWELGIDESHISYRYYVESNKIAVVETLNEDEDSRVTEWMTLGKFIDTSLI